MGKKCTVDTELEVNQGGAWNSILFSVNGGPAVETGMAR